VCRGDSRASVTRLKRSLKKEDNFMTGERHNGVHLQPQDRNPYRARKKLNLGSSVRRGIGMTKWGEGGRKMAKNKSPNSMNNKILDAYEIEKKKDYQLLKGVGGQNGGNVEDV